MVSSQIRNSFLNFFKKNGHEIVDSDSVVPQNDPSLLFTNAGMVQFKNIFTGHEERKYKRATTSQKCIRAGGKHNDLDQVGFTARHHTFFEMLGNFSFGDYFKEEAIDFAWTFLTKELGLSRQKLLVTVYHTDEEAKNIWKKVAGDIAIIPITTSDNFWSMGETGPCGPCTEIFYDHGENVPGGIPGSPDQDGDRYMEIWNVVFMQFEQKSNGERLPLAKKSIDTGMGLERISSVMQGVNDNYETDLFVPIIDRIKNLSQTNFPNIHSSYKVIADHIRSISFLIADGVLPSNEGRGYVLRRILRRAMRHGTLLNINGSFLFNLSNSLIDKMKDIYPELQKAREIISSTILSEEEKFLTTLDRGLKILQSEIKEIPHSGVLSGDKAFKLYDTYGFPLDLTQDILKADGISVDIDGFNAALEDQKNRAKWTGSGDVKNAEVWHNLKKRIYSVEFCGYEKTDVRSKILAIVQNEEEVSSLSSGKAFIVTKETPFYPEGGGQCGDCGCVKSKNGHFIVKDTQKFCNDIIAHSGEVSSGFLQVADEVDLEIDMEARRKIAANHTATHLLQAALQLVVGKHIAQRGSFLNTERLRFDFSNPSAVSANDLLKVEKFVNEWIAQDLEIISRIMSKKNAMEKGAMALFGEKYADSVRTISVFSAEKRVSFELCGGTHVASTGKIGLFKILSETSIGAGVRRIEAITGERILEYIKGLEETLFSLEVKFKCNSSELMAKTENLLTDLKQRNHEILSIKLNEAANNINESIKNGINIYTAIVSNYSIDELRMLHDAMKAKKSSGIFLVFSKNKDKTSIIVSVTQDLQGKFHAGNILRAGLTPLNGKGGGNAAFAQGGGSNQDKISESIDSIMKYIQ
ncbi:MAG: alanine--tRNA ligase [Holosporaceae bacterium]|jgi:alanyl-tRNA synthetase|nr:alanine--tRNA ligase [Holosporaceae bacterium]